MLFKRLVAVVLALAMSVSVLASCGRVENDNDDKNGNSSVSDKAERSDDKDSGDGKTGGKTHYVSGGIAAAILIPAFIGYTKDSKLSSANSTAKTVYTALNSYCQKCVNYGAPVSDGIYSGTVGYSRTEISLTYDGSDSDLNNAVGNYLNTDADGSQWEVKIQNGFPVSVIWKNNPSDKYVGRYPNAATDKNAELEEYYW